MRDRSAETESAYDAVAADYAARTEDRPADAFFARFMALLPPRARVADVGCGPGRDLRRLIEETHRPLGVDRSAALLGLATAVGRIRGDFRRLPLADASLDAIWSHASLLHVEPSDLAATLAEFERALRSGASSVCRRRSAAIRAGSWCQRAGTAFHSCRRVWGDYVDRFRPQHVADFVANGE